MFYISHSGARCPLSIYNPRMRFARYPLAAFTLLCLLLFVLSLWPIPHQAEKNVIASALDLALTAFIDLEYPEQIRLGTSAPLHLTTRLATDSSQPKPTLTIINLETACLNVDPVGDMSQSVNFDQPQTWIWQLTATESLGSCNLDLLVRLRVDSTDRLIWVRHLSIATTTIFGLPTPVAQAFGLAGSILSLLALAAIQLRTSRHP